MDDCSSSRHPYHSRVDLKTRTLTPHYVDCTCRKCIDLLHYSLIWNVCIYGWASPAILIACQVSFGILIPHFTLLAQPAFFPFRMAWHSGFSPTRVIDGGCIPVIQCVKQYQSIFPVDQYICTSVVQKSTVVTVDYIVNPLKLGTWPLRGLLLFTWPSERYECTSCIYRKLRMDIVPF